MDLEQLKINFQIAVEHSNGNKISLKNVTLGTILRIASGYPFWKYWYITIIEWFIIFIWVGIFPGGKKWIKEDSLYLLSQWFVLPFDFYVSSI